MLYYNQYVRAESLDEAYDLYQKKNNFILAGMLWQKMRNKTMGTAIDLCGLGLDKIEETEEAFRIGAYVSLRDLETDEALNTYTGGAFRESVRHIVGVQFRFSDVMTIFRALGAKVELHHAGMMDLDDFVKLPRKTRDILVAVIVPKNVKGVVYVSQRNQSTDFPVLTCAVAKRADGYAAAIGATPHLAEVVVVPERELSELSDEQMDAFAGQVCDEIRFGSNMRAGAAYRKTVCRVLVRRAMQALKGELD